MLISDKNKDLGNKKRFGFENNGHTCLQKLIPINKDLHFILEYKLNVDQSFRAVLHNLLTIRAALQTLFHFTAAQFIIQGHQLCIPCFGVMIQPIESERADKTGPPHHLLKQHVLTD